MFSTDWRVSLFIYLLIQTSSQTIRQSCHFCLLNNLKWILSNRCCNQSCLSCWILWMSDFQVTKEISLVIFFVMQNFKIVDCTVYNRKCVRLNQSVYLIDHWFDESPFSANPQGATQTQLFQTRIWNSVLFLHHE